MLIGDVSAKEQLVEHRLADLELARRRVSDVQEALKLPDERASFELSAQLKAAEAEVAGARRALSHDKSELKRCREAAGATEDQARRMGALDKRTGPLARAFDLSSARVAADLVERDLDVQAACGSDGAAELQTPRDTARGHLRQHCSPLAQSSPSVAPPEEKRSRTDEPALVPPMPGVRENLMGEAVQAADSSETSAAARGDKKRGSRQLRETPSDEQYVSPPKRFAAEEVEEPLPAPLVGGAAAPAEAAGIVDAGEARPAPRWAEFTLEVDRSAHRCQARMWRCPQGLGPQCSRKVETSGLCVKHAKELRVHAVERGDMACPTHGFVYDDIPNEKFEAYRREKAKEQRKAVAIPAGKSKGLRSREEKQ